MIETCTATDGRRRWCRTVMEVFQTMFVLAVVYPHHVTTWQYQRQEPRSRESLQGWPAGVQRFEGSTTESDHFKVLQLDGDHMVIGAKNFLYNVSVDTFNQVMSLRWEVQNHEREYCTSKQRTLGQCQNYIRIIARKSSTELFVCGTNAYKPKCRTYSISGTQYRQISEESGTGKCPFDPEHNSTTLYSDGKVFSGTSVNHYRKDPLIYSHPMRTVQHDSLWLNDPDFAGSFEYGDKIYFLFRETALEYINCGKRVYSRVGRLCKNDRGGMNIMRTTWTSFFKSRLNCSVPGEYPFYFDEIQSMSMLNDGNYQPSTSNKSKILYAVFNTPGNSIRGSAVCAFRMEDIERSFEGTFKQQETAKSNWLPVGSDKIPNPHPAQTCHDSKQILDEDLNFIKLHPLMDESVPAYGGAPVFVHTGFNYQLTQIAIDWQFLAADGRNYDIIFTGTDDGKVIKSVNTGTGDKIIPVTIEEIQVFPLGVPVISLKVYRLPGKRGSDPKLIAMSRDEIKSILLNRCTKHKSCRECVKIQDPYCAWSTYYKTCIVGPNGAALIQNIETGTDSRCDGLPEGFRPSASTHPPPTCAPCECPVVPTRPRRTFRPEVSTRRPDVERYPYPTKTQKPIYGGEDKNNVNKPDPRSGGVVSEHTVTGYSGTTLALGIVFSIILSLAAGFLTGFFFSVKRTQWKHNNLPPPAHLADIGTVEKNKNVYVEQPVKTVDNNIQEKQINVMYNPVKPNNKLPNGGADLQVSPKKVYL